METKIFLVTMSFGLGLGSAAMHTDDPSGLLASILATGATLEHVSISNAKADDQTDAERDTDEQQSWHFMEWS